MGLLGKIFHRFLSKYIECARMYKINLNTYTNDFKLKDKHNFTFKMLDKNEFEKLSYLYQNDYEKLKIVNNRLNSGNYLCFSYIDNENKVIVYARWICKKEYYSDILREKLHFKENQALTLDSWTHPNYRGLGLHRNMNIKMLNWIKENTDITEVYMVIKIFIPHIKKIAVELGYKPIKTYFHFK
tara:strand:- start:2785 stop:3339 length:555 start_codon:yes stop_codon:yes gene_type:complete